MAPGPQRCVRLILAAWAVGLGGLAGLTVWGNVAMARYGAHVRDRRPETHIALAVEAAEKGNFHDALAHWRDARDRAPKRPDVHKVLGDFQFELTHYELALRAYKEALECGSISPGVRLNALWCLVQLERYQEALAFGRLCVQEGMTDPDLYRRMGEACFRAKMFAEAIPLYNKALDGYPNNLYLMEHLRQAYQGARQPKRAKDMAARIVALENSLGVVKGGAT